MLTSKRVTYTTSLSIEKVHGFSARAVRVQTAKGTAKHGVTATTMDSF